MKKMAKNWAKNLDHRKREGYLRIENLVWMVMMIMMLMMTMMVGVLVLRIKVEVTKEEQV